jgi:hypothetical protein
MIRLLDGFNNVLAFTINFVLCGEYCMQFQLEVISNSQLRIVRSNSGFKF